MELIGQGKAKLSLLPMVGEALSGSGPGLGEAEAQEGNPKDEDSGVFRSSTSD